MITYREAVEAFDAAIVTATSFLKRKNFLFPMLFVLKKGSLLNVRLKNESVINIDYADVQPTDAPDTIYKTIVAFKVENEQDRKAIQEVSTLVALTYKPDAIGIVMTCLYNEGVWTGTYIPMDRDPECVRGLHACFYIKDQKKPLLRTDLIMDKGKIESGVWKDADDDSPNFALYFSRGLWTPPHTTPTVLVPVLKNPYETA